ncbi:MAG: hypothetical protein BWZ10_02807 [candidate division BRC1 bacterium ADurb.BinA364]|nr:MAG: hypothetical protein BWZ10_02807 [candidate division BRC1 bacterium ADurb.BinA364]
MAVGYDDPLADLVKRLNASAGPAPKLHAWIAPLRLHNEREFIPPGANHIALRHPEWISQDIEGDKADADGWLWLDPGLLETRNYIVDIVVELVENYPIDGVFLDELRYPDVGGRFGYNPLALERYRAETGARGVPDPLDAQWQAWRREQLTATLAAVSAEVKKRHPEMVVSVAAYADGVAPKTLEGFRHSLPYVEALQDWPEWGRLRLADWICLRNFQDEQTQRKAFDDWNAFAASQAGESKLWVAVAGYRNWAIDVFRQVQRARMSGAVGVAIQNFRQPVLDLATASDFFSALRALATMSESQLSQLHQPGEASPELIAQLERMSRAAERPTAELAQGAPDLAAIQSAPPFAESAAGADSAATPSAPEAAEAPPAHPPFREPWDTIHLTNRATFQGQKITEINGESFFETSTGMMIKIGNQYIDRIERAGATE